ncbi:MAG: endonuclease domain-containing protein [Actinomycetota bacterium]|nr:endonuclease domain-containing protein [Actinomycetota bacterium]
MEGIEGTPLEVSTTRDVRRLPGVIVHRVTSWPPCDIETSVTPITKPERTLLDLAATIPVARLELALDSSLRRRITTVPRLQWRLNEVGTKGKARSNVLRQLLAERPVGQAVPESGLETRLHRLIADSELPPPERQYVIRSGNNFVARVDFAYPKQRVAIEADGYRYHSGRQVWERDLARRNALQGLGWSVLHFTHHQVVHRRENVVSTIESALWCAPLGSSLQMVQ